jgi:hypothetical protein
VPPQYRYNGQAVKQMLNQHLCRLADSRKVIGLVPALQLLQIAQQKVCTISIRRHIQRCQGCG